MRPICGLALCLLIACGDGRAADAPSADQTANKLTFAYYLFSSDKTGVDVNIRHTFDTSTAWIGDYHETGGFDQLRAGYEYDFHHDWLTLVPSVQVASHDFLGATVYLEGGRSVYAIAGAGRTNLEPYWNLGFDPNDYVQFGGGYRGPTGNTVSVYTIRDIRLHTGQTNTHFYARRRFSPAWRLTVDVVREHGNGDDGLVVRAWSGNAEVDWRRWFGRVAVDPHVNYTPDHQVR